MFSRTDASGVSSDLTLSVADNPIAESCREVYMQVKTLKKP
jgi:hypothetical protein